MTDTLVAWADGREMGRIDRTRNRLSFAYDDRWREAVDAYPLSLSMPLAARQHGHAAIEPFLWGLLPDNALILDRWARRFQVSARNPFALLAQVGEDCAGAVQFVVPSRLEVLRQGGEDGVDWLDQAGVSERLRALHADLAAWRLPRDTGQFSLAGAQPKTALIFDGTRWGVPYGRTPTTHILKPPAAAFDGHAENEHACLELARRLGLPAAISFVARFEDQVAVAVERYDRYAAKDGRLLRIHQEDFCQALAVSPLSKYQNEGRPGPREIIGVLREASADPATDVATFVDALILNWLIGGTDAHAKNYAMLIAPERQARLAPLYDVASALPYPDFDFQSLRLAMKIGDTYRLRDIGARQWRAFCADVRLDTDVVLARVAAICTQAPDLTQAIVTRARTDGLSHAILDRLIAAISVRSRGILQTLEYRGG